MASDSTERDERVIQDFLAQREFDAATRLQAEHRGKKATTAALAVYFACDAALRAAAVAVFGYAAGGWVGAAVAVFCLGQVVLAYLAEAQQRGAERELPARFV